MITTYVFGAGASCHAGYPLASEMGNGLLDFMMKSSNMQYQSAGKYLIDSFGTSPNIENLITELQSRISSLKNAQSSEDRTQRTRLGNSLGFLRTSLVKWFQEIHTHRASSYAAFADRIVRPGDVIITFNYDDSLERELKRACKWDISRGYGFRLGAMEHSSDVLMLKLHGSINWMLSLFNGATNFFQISGSSSLETHPIIHQAALEYLGYQEFAGHTYQGGGVLHCLILPGYTKEFFYDTSFGNEFADFWNLLWSQGADAVRRSDRIVICGYSLLPVDQRACDLLLQMPQKDIRIEVISGNQTERIAEDFRAAGFHNVRAFDGGCFEDWVQSEVQCC